MSSPNDNINLKDGGDSPFKMRAKDVSALSDGSLQQLRHLATLYPVDYGVGGCFHTTVKSGIMAAGLAANAPIISFRNPSSTLNAIVRRIRIAAWSLGTGFTAGLGTFELYEARSFTAADTGGALVGLIDPQAQLATIMGQAASTIRVSTTATLTAGTRTLDTLPLEALNVAVSTATNTPFVGSNVGNATMFDKRQGEHPLLLALNEGFVMQATVPATGTWSFTTTIEWDEIPLVNF